MRKQHYVIVIVHFKQDDDKQREVDNFNNNYIRIIEAIIYERVGIKNQIIFGNIA